MEGRALSVSISPMPEALTGRSRRHPAFARLWICSMETVYGRAFVPCGERTGGLTIDRIHPGARSSLVPGARAWPASSSMPSALGAFVERPRLQRRLEESSAPVVLLDAPTGYGKSVLLAQWAAADPRPFASVTLGDEHNDPVAVPCRGDRGARSDRARVGRALVGARRRRSSRAPCCRGSSGHSPRARCRWCSCLTSSSTSSRRRRSASSGRSSTTCHRPRNSP